jgi:hypothetical protein
LRAGGGNTGTAIGDAHLALVLPWATYQPWRRLSSCRSSKTSGRFRCCARRRRWTPTARIAPPTDPAYEPPTDQIAIGAYGPQLSLSDPPREIEPWLVPFFLVRASRLVLVDVPERGIILVVADPRVAAGWI